MSISQYFTVFSDVVQQFIVSAASLGHVEGHDVIFCCFGDSTCTWSVLAVYKSRRGRPVSALQEKKLQDVSTELKPASMTLSWTGAEAGSGSGPGSRTDSRTCTVVLMDLSSSSSSSPSCCILLQMSAVVSKHMWAMQGPLQPLEGPGPQYRNWGKKKGAFLTSGLQNKNMGPGTVQFSV